MGNFRTEQEAFWAGEFGDDYSDRNVGAQWVGSNLALFSRILSGIERPASIIEFGANIGLNLLAIEQLLPGADLAAIEINDHAVAKLRALEGLTVYAQSILDFVPDVQRDLVLIKGVLIHNHPDELPGIYDKLYASSKRYICLAEYYNPQPVEVPYRGHSGKLFKRDFAGEMLDRFPDLRLVDYGFVYHRDQFPQDDITWFLMEKNEDE